MPTHIVKINDRFRLCRKEWKVETVGGTLWFNARWDEGDCSLLGYFPLSGADELEWIEEEVTFSEKQIEEILHRVNYNIGDKESLSRWLNAHKEK